MFLKIVKKPLIIFLMTIFLTLFTCACNNEQSQILFNKYPFSTETLHSTSNIFKPNERIYYLVTLPKPVVTKKLFIQVVKTDGKTIAGDSADRLGYDLVWSRHVKLKNEQIYYFTDYVVFNETGVYIMKVYSKDNPTKILTSSQFYVRN